MAPSAKRSRTRLGIRKATLYASIAAVAPKKCARTCSRTRPRIRLVMVAAPAEAAERASVRGALPAVVPRPCSGRLCGSRGVEGSAAKFTAHRVVDRAAVYVLSRQLRHDGFHHLAHILR